mmetsp:Transcript_40559/g.72968  ORF Transcript_40559/g.72968 Transcript_40559/m.72968 type:complete len:272 (-) Transcript_40559:115-930(-)
MFIRFYPKTKSMHVLLRDPLSGTATVFALAVLRFLIFLVVLKLDLFALMVLFLFLFLLAILFSALFLRALLVSYKIHWLLRSLNLLGFCAFRSAAGVWHLLLLLFLLLLCQASLGATAPTACDCPAVIIITILRRASSRGLSCRRLGRTLRCPVEGQTSPFRRVLKCFWLWLQLATCLPMEPNGESYQVKIICGQKTKVTSCLRKLLCVSDVLRRWLLDLELHRKALKQGFRLLVAHLCIDSAGGQELAAEALQSLQADTGACINDHLAIR